MHEIKPHHFEIERRGCLCLRIDGHEIILAGHLQTMPSIEEQANIATAKSRTFRSKVALSTSIPSITWKPSSFSTADMSAASFRGFVSSPAYLYAEFPITSATRFSACATDCASSRRTMDKTRNVSASLKNPQRPYHGPNVAAVAQSRCCDGFRMPAPARKSIRCVCKLVRSARVWSGVQF